MSSQTNNKNNDSRLKALLNNSQAESSDPFEKEAAEGFLMLENEQQAFQLKTALDEKIRNQALFENKKPRFNYWLAAAGLIFAVGASIYVINSASENNNDLAVSNQKVAPLAEPSPTVNSDQALVKEAPPAEISSANAPSGLTTSSPNLAFGKKSVTKNQAAAPQLSEAKGEADLAMSDENSAAIQSAPAKPEAYMNQPVLSNDADLDSVGESKEIIAKNLPLIKAAEAKKRSQVYSEEREKLSRAEKTSMAGAKADAPGSTTTNQDVVFPGGEKTLNNIIRKELTGANANEPFDALLLISEKGLVETATITAANGLNATEQQNRIKVLKSLKGFIVNQANQSFPASYILKYR